MGSFGGGTVMSYAYPNMDPRNPRAETGHRMRNADKTWNGLAGRLRRTRTRFMARSLRVTDVVPGVAPPGLPPPLPTNTTLDRDLGDEPNRQQNDACDDHCCLPCSCTPRCLYPWKNV